MASISASVGTCAIGVSSCSGSSQRVRWNDDGLLCTIVPTAVHPAAGTGCQAPTVTEASG